MSERGCFHCGAEIPRGVVIEADGPEGMHRSFCCRGCHGAYLLIGGAGLEAVYERRQRPQPGRVQEPDPSAYDEAVLWRSIRPAGELCTLDLIIEGVRCASCVWLLEKMVGRIHGVREVRVNYATGRASVSFAPHDTPPAEICRLIAALGYLPRPYSETEARRSAERERQDLLIRFGTAFFLTMQLMAYAFALYAGYFQGMAPSMKRFMQLFSFLVTTPVIFYCGAPFLTGAWRSVRNRAPDMDLLIALGALSSYGFSIYAGLSGGEVYYETAAMIITLILAGRLLENGAKRRAAGGVQRLLQLAPATARRLREGRSETVPVGALLPGDLLLVAPGERFPVDGRVEGGSGEVDQAPITGEPFPVHKETGDPVRAGSTNITAALRVRCEKAFDESFVARAARLVAEAQGRKAPIQGVADRIAARFVPLVLLLATGTFLWHARHGAPADAALMSALSVLVIACPCAVGLATPTAIAAGTGAAAGMGIIFKGGDVLERLNAVTLAVFDKTGTLTCGNPVLAEVHPATGMARDRLVALAAAVECGSLHPIGRAVCAFAEKEAIPYAAGDDLRATPGGGVSGKVAGEEIAVGSARFLAGLGCSAGLQARDGEAAGATAFVAINGLLAGSLCITDELRRNAPAVAGALHTRGIRTILLSGDHPERARRVAALLGLSEGIGDTSPEEKARRIEEYRHSGETVLMVGDGINDAPALAAADVGCAMAGGTDIALETSDLVLARSDLELLVTAQAVARRTMAVVRQNLGWAFLYNLIGIPLAMTGRLTPVYAAAAMAASSLLVVGNSLRLLRGERSLSLRWRRLVPAAAESR